MHTLRGHCSWTLAGGASIKDWHTLGVRPVLEVTNACAHTEYTDTTPDARVANWYLEAALDKLQDSGPAVISACLLRTFVPGRV